MIDTKRAICRPIRKRARAHVETPLPEPIVHPSAILGRRSSKVLLGALFIASLAVYAATCARTVTGEDSGELIAAAYTMGVAHPPGYPSWTLLAKVATLVPIGEVAFRVALLSAFFGALTAVLLGAILLVLTQSRFAAVAGAGAFALLRDQWSQATIAEVYTLNTAFLAGSLLLLLLWSEEKSWRLFYAFAFVFGLSLTNHHLMLGAAPPFLAILLIKGWRLLRDWKRVLGGVACFAAGLVPYAYLPIAASRGPDMNWGDPRTLQRVLDHVARRQYLDSEKLPERSLARFFDQLGVAWDAFTGQGATIVLVVGLVACVLLARRRPLVCLLLFGVAVTTSIGFILQTNVGVDFESAYASRLFHVPAWMMLSIAFGVAVAALLARLHRQPGIAVGSLIVAASIGAPLHANAAECDYSSYDVAAVHGRRLLQSVPREAILFPSSDHTTFPLIYLRLVEGMRPDVTLGDKYGYVDPPIYRRAPFVVGLDERSKRTSEFREAVERWLLETARRPLFFSSKKAMPEGYGLAGEGLWYRARRNDTPRSILEEADAAAFSAALATPLVEPPRPLDYTARLILGDVRFAQARRAFATGRSADGLAATQSGTVLVERSKEALNNFGSLLAESGELASAEPLFRQALAIDGTYVTAARNLASSLLAADRRTEAKTAFLGVLALSPLDPHANRALATIAKKDGSFGEAVVHLAEVGRVTGDPAAFRDAGLIYLLELRQLKRAKEMLRASLRINPNQPDIAEVEADIKPKDEGGEQSKDARAQPSGGKDDHANHDCVALGCKAMDSASRLGMNPTVPLPSAPNPLSTLTPKNTVPITTPIPDAQKSPRPGRPPR